MTRNPVGRCAAAMALALLCLAATTPARADRLDDDLQTVWEVLAAREGARAHAQ